MMSHFIPKGKVRGTVQGTVQETVQRKGAGIGLKVRTKGEN